MKEKETKKTTSLSVKLMAGFLALLMLAGTVFGVVAFIINK